MAVEILRPQDCFVGRIGVSPCRRKNHNYNFNSGHNYYNYPTNPNPNPNPRPNRKPAVRTDQRKRQPEPPSPANKRSSSSSDDLKISRNQFNRHGNKVSILRRGESLDSKMKSMEMAAKKVDRSGYLVVTGTGRLGPDPEMIPKQIRIADFRSPDMYAGSGFAISPAPSSLPLPSFSKMKQLAVDDSATRDLRRLLRLDF